MIRSPLRAGLALACTLSLSACGGGDGDVYLGGTVSGVTKAGLVLTINDGSDYAIDQSGPFRFPNPVETDLSYTIRIKSLPVNAEKCEITGGAVGRAVFNINNIVVECTIRSWELGGTIEGLNGATGLVLVNGADRLAVTPGAGSSQTFQMPTKVPEEFPYGVTVLNQPDNRTCTVQNGTGTMQGAKIETIRVLCVAKS